MTSGLTTRWKTPRASNAAWTAWAFNAADRLADNSPLVYLVLIDQIDFLPQLFETVLVPEPVHAELRNAAAPATIQTWAKSLPSWVEVRQGANISDDAELRPLGAGARAAITLALSIDADLVLIDERKRTQYST